MTMFGYDQPETLYVNKSESRCGSCHKNADPYEVSHVSTFTEGDGCGVVYKYVDSDYVGIGIPEWTAEERPDLIYVGGEPVGGYPRRDWADAYFDGSLADGGKSDTTSRS